ncbi:MAG: glycerate kinase type-2 family protein [Xanthobacteraceae bacterium]
MATLSRDLLESLFRTAVIAAHPSHCLPANLPDFPATGRLIMLAGGKAAGSMIEAAERHYQGHMAGRSIDAGRLIGIGVTRYGYGRPTRRIKVLEAGHPLPDLSGVNATASVLALADEAHRDDLVLVLLSGGASATWVAPAGLTLAEKQAVTQALLRSGAHIGEINCVRKHLSRIKGGRLAQRAQPARVVTLAISDVPGDDPAVIGSGPTVPDPSTLADVQAILGKYRLELPEAVMRVLADPKSESPKPGASLFANTAYSIVARPADALAAARTCAEATGYECVVLGDRLQGEAREVAAEHAQLARDLAAHGRRAVILSGGELTVTLRGSGRGGPNQEYALALAIRLAGAKGIAALAADTDGTDGGSGRPDDPAGAFIDETTLQRAAGLGLDPAAFLADNDSTGFFNAIADLFQPGPTFTNVTDFRAILVDRPPR